ncbi:8629_t:CDS:1, partial [Funneliformis caledonium]
KHSSKHVNSGSMELFLEYFETTLPEKYQFLDYYQYNKSRDGFTNIFRQEAKKTSSCLGTSGEK